MDYTVSDFYHVFEEKFVLLAGKGGLSRNVNSVGILDYELDPSVKDRYICDNFREGMLDVPLCQKESLSHRRRGAPPR